MSKPPEFEQLAHRRMVKGRLFRIWTEFRLWVKIIVIVIFLTPVVILAWSFVIAPRFWCGEDVKRVGDQCIGVTDGQVLLRADLADVLGKIRAENEMIDRSGQDAVSVAHLVSLPAPSSNDELEVVLRREIEGAYIAQWQANHNEALGNKPLIRLLIANYGDGSSEVNRVVPTLLNKVNGPDRLVAAVVTGRTLKGTLDAIDDLRKGGIPVISSRLTGDSLTNLNEHELAAVRGGLARVAPTNSDQTIAAAASLKREASRAVLVQDTKPGDPYLTTLGNAFKRGFEDETHHVLEPVEKYNSALGGAANTMAGMLSSICHQKPDVVFFAGRSPELGAFVQALPGRWCLGDTQIKIVAGADAVEFATEMTRGNNPELRKGLNANASVRYTTQAHPGSWTISDESFSPQSRRHFDFCAGCYGNLFPGQSLDDGAAIMGYDAIFIMVRAIRSGQVINDRPELISQQFNRMHGTEAVGGASGWISLKDGNVVNKAVAILEVKPDGSVKFLALSSVDGSPCVPNKTRC